MPRVCDDSVSSPTDISRKGRNHVQTTSRKRAQMTHRLGLKYDFISCSSTNAFFLGITFVNNDHNMPTTHFHHHHPFDNYPHLWSTTTNNYHDHPHSTTTTTHIPHLSHNPHNNLADFETTMAKDRHSLQVLLVYCLKIKELLSRQEQYQ